ncbi:amidase [Nesterenkonia sp. NBAIMH1]|uniref:amidase n=1 Tax=Nesterenkonia sp. NBAIMH1 TaxID=2600320 RepID=UPI00210F2A91|nr:amidase [Nesterenkonia sp. NBAIMH1]
MRRSESEPNRDVVEMSIAEMLHALKAGELTSVDLVCAYINRIAWFDRTGLCLNAVPVLNPEALAEAEASDARRRSGRAGPLEGVPFTVKDSYMAAGLTVASGSPALKDLVAQADAATVALLRQAGAVLIGKTNMPPMAAGGIQPGVYGYPRSPYNPQYIAAAYGSGSSSGSAVSVAASFCAFGMAEETVSSGRSPASNNSVVAYTPSRGVISIRGNWPLRPTCDVVVPHTRTVEDLLHLVGVLAAEDEETAGDFWREQRVIDLPSPAEVFPEPVLRERPERLDGLRFAVPRMYIGRDDDLLVPPAMRPTVRALWEQAASDLRSLGAEVVETDFPAVSNYEEDRPGADGLPARGLVPAQWRDIEGGTITAMALDSFLRRNGDPTLNTWADVDAESVFPSDDAPTHVWITRARGGFDWQRLSELTKAGLPSTYDDVPGIEHLLQGLEEARTRDFEEWMLREGLDGVVFPAVGDVGRDDLFSRPESLDHASQNGVVYSNGNRVIRHLGIPTVTVPMGFMADIQMPVGLTFAGPAYSDDTLLTHALAYEKASRRRQKAFLTPTLASSQIAPTPARGQEPISFTVRIESDGPFWSVTVRLGGGAVEGAHAWADGHILEPEDGQPDLFRGRVSRARKRLAPHMLVAVKAAAGATFSLEELPQDD